MTMNNAPSTRSHHSTRKAVSVLLVTLLALFGMTAFAQQADPLAGTTVELLGATSPTAAQTQNLVFMRITMAPGAVIPAHRHPGAVVVMVLSGLFGTDFVEGAGQLQRAGAAAAEPINGGSETTMSAGDSLAYEGAVHTMRNDGPDDLVLLVSALLDPAQPGFIFQNAQ